MSGPMNMEEWQRRMKAEKEAARKKKSESTQILHGYRGGVRDEELKLKKLREEERQRQLDAERNLHSYQAKELDGIKAMEQKTPRQQQAIQADASSSATKNYMDGFAVVAGSVSERAAALAVARGEERVFHSDVDVARGETHLFQPNISFDTPLEVHHPAEEAEDLIPDSIAESVLGENETTSQDIVAEVDVYRSDEQVPKLQQSQESDRLRAVEKASDAIRPTETNGSTLTRTNVLFSFGVVSIHNNPELFGYMAATAKVVTQCLDRSNVSGIIYDANLKPFVRTCVPDASYIPRVDKSNTKRSLVTAAVPIMYDQTVLSRAEAKKVVVTALQDAIQSGAFLQLAQSVGSETIRQNKI